MLLFDGNNPKFSLIRISISGFPWIISGNLNYFMAVLSKQVRLCENIEYYCCSKKRLLITLVFKRKSNMEGMFKDLLYHSIDTSGQVCDKLADIVEIVIN